MHENALEFIKITKATDPGEHVEASFILDTQVSCELYSVRDIMVELAEHGLSIAALARRWLRHPAHPLKHTLVLAWWLSRRET